MTTNNSKRWTSEEDNILLAAVKGYPQNLKKAFEIVGERIGRSKTACSARWYCTLSKTYKDNPKNVCFAIFSSNKYGINRKNCKQISTTRVNRSVWRSILNFIKILPD